MQDIGREEDTELSRKDSTLNWQELSVESLGNCQSVGNLDFFETGMFDAAQRAGSDIKSGGFWQL
jgi:hypothetical protein